MYFRVSGIREDKDYSLLFAFNKDTHKPLQALSHGHKPTSDPGATPVCPHSSWLVEELWEQAEPETVLQHNPHWEGDIKGGLRGNGSKRGTVEQKRKKTSRGKMRDGKSQILQSPRERWMNAPFWSIQKKPLFHFIEKMRPDTYVQL